MIMRLALPEDARQLVGLMAEFYAESDFRLNNQRAESAFTTILTDDRLGSVWLIEEVSQAVGYLVLTVCFSMEYGGRIAFVDDFYVKPTFRGVGVGTKALAQARDWCVRQDIRGMSVEVASKNAAAQKVYRRTGFEETDRQLLRLGLAEPTHVV
jgi:ribosomal protein S18 acetylase RimI-like enzyme